MKIRFTGLRAGILTQLIFLIVAAMLLINVAMLNLYEKYLIKEKGNTGAALAAAVEEIVSAVLRTERISPGDLRSSSMFRSSLERLLNSSGYSDIIIVGKDDEVLFSTEFPDRNRQYNLILAMEAKNTLTGSVDIWGSTWGVLWLRKSDISISAPIRYGKDRHAGGLAVRASLVPVYETMRRSEKLVILYIILDTVILAFVGIYLLSRIVVTPIHRLLKMTEEYEDGEFIPAGGETPENEIGNLSRSLSGMFKRLDENKSELKEHILSLERANNDLKAAQKEIIRSEKLVSVGRLAAGIAHEIGNPIGIILGYLDMIKKGNLSEGEEKDFIERAESEITRISTIIRQLLDFSRESAEKKEDCNIHEIINNTSGMLLHQTMMKDIRINLNLDAEQDIVLADKNRILQVFLNIMMNSVDALKDENHAAENPEIDIFTSIENGLINIEFVDNGPGISADELNHIFDPFFTTKDPGRGTGLGLSVCYRIIENLGGDIRAESSPGKGTKIIIRLPLSQDTGNEFQGDSR